MAYFRCNTTEIFIFSLKYRQQKVDLNTSKKSLVFVTIRHKIYLRAAVVYENFIFTQKYAFAERCCFLTFSFEGKLRKYDISVKRKHTKTNENMIFSALFTNFRKTKILFFMQCTLILKRMQIQPNPAFIPNSPSLFWKFFSFMETVSGKKLSERMLCHALNRSSDCFIATPEFQMFSSKSIRMLTILIRMLTSIKYLAKS